MNTQCPPALLKKAFRKLLSYAYYDKSDMHLRRSISEFVKKISRSKTIEDEIFKKLSDMAEGKDETYLDSLLSEMRMLYFPKELKTSQNLDKRYVTNAPREENVITRLLIKSYIPVELLIVDVAWILQHGYVLDVCLPENCRGNRLIMDETGLHVCDDEKVLFHNYSRQYQSWWMKGIETANEYLQKDKNITIVNLDVTNFYHTLNVDFDAVVDFIAGEPEHADVKNARTTNIVRRILRKYSEIAHASGVKVFDGAVNTCPLPLSLMSSALIANWYLKPLDDAVHVKLKPLYYGRYVDDVMIVGETKSSEIEPLLRAQEELSPLLKKVGRHLQIDVKKNKICQLKIQEKKVYVYSFTSSISQLSIEKYVSEQMKRGSEFRFMTDEVAPDKLELENITLVGALDANYDEEKRFDILEDSKYRLSVYLSKLAARLSKNPQDAKCILEVNKIAPYFQGVLLIKHYLLWEKLLTLFVLAKQFGRFNQFVFNIKKEIKKLQIDSNVFSLKRFSHCENILKASLRYHLEQTRLMALSLNRHGCNIDTIFCDSLMVRMHFNSFPLQEFSSRFKDKGVTLSLRDMEPYSQFRLSRYRWVPYYVKFADIVCACSLGKRFCKGIYERAWKLYCDLNSYENDLKSYKDCVYFLCAKGDVIAEFNTESTLTQRSSSPIYVSLVEMEMEKTPKSMVRSFGKNNQVYDKKLRIALDKISENSNTDMFIMPECSLSLSELKEFCLYSAKNRVAFVSGMEYYISQKIVYNYIVTCLPIKLHERVDALPILRRKNFYAPFEIEQIVECGYQVPNDEDCQALYHWAGHVFTSYCCFELCNPKHRTFFFNDIDAMYCPVYNKDTYYFNNIAESTARDMHCYFVLSNVSGFGDSRVSEPAKHDRMNLLKVKGGNTIDNEVMVLSCSLDYEKLRRFQLGKEDKGAFKPLPPGFQKERVRRRMWKFLLKKRNDNQGNVLNVIWNSI